MFDALAVVPERLTAGEHDPRPRLSRAPPQGGRRFALGLGGSTMRPAARALRAARSVSPGHGYADRAMVLHDSAPPASLGVRQDPRDDGTLGNAPGGPRPFGVLLPPPINFEKPR